MRACVRACVYACVRACMRVCVRFLRACACACVHAFASLFGDFDALRCWTCGGVGVLGTTLQKASG